MNDLLQNPIALLVAGSVVGWLVTRLFNYLADPAKAQIEAVKAEVKQQGEVLQAALDRFEKALENSTSVTRAVVDLANDLKARVMVLEDFKQRHEREEG